MQHNYRALICVLFLFTFLGAPALAQNSQSLLPFPSAEAEGASGKIYQLTNAPESPVTGNYDWYALYYHDNDTTIQNYDHPGPGNKLVLRRIASSGSFEKKGNASSLVYFALDLDSGTLTPITREGLTNAAFVKGGWLYAMERDNISQHYFKLVRYDLNGSKSREIFGVYPALANSEKEMGGNIAVSDDEHYLIWTETNARSGSQVFYLKNLMDLKIDDAGGPVDVSAMIDNNNGSNIAHFQFLRGVNGARFTCMDQSKQASAILQRIGVGRADVSHPSCKSLKMRAESPLNHYGYFHPFVDVAGYLWADAARWNKSGDMNFYGDVRFDQWDEDGTLTHVTWYDADSTPFQLHTNFTVSPQWFLGDGATVIGKSGGKSTGGLDAIYLLHMADGKISSTVLARRAPGVDAIDGNLQPNVHLAYLMNRWGAVWTEWRSIVPGQAATQNVFFAPLPSGLTLP